jgi:hypothetical protein
VVVDSLSQEIIDKGGEEIPANRDYSTIMTGKPPVQNYEVGDVVELDKSIGGTHGTKARITKKVKIGNENKFEVLFPDNTSFWTNELAIVGKTTETPISKIEVATEKPIIKSEPIETTEPTKDDLIATLTGAKITLKYLTGDEKKQFKDYIKGLEVTIKYM